MHSYSDPYQSVSLCRLPENLALVEMSLFNFTSTSWRQNKIQRFTLICPPPSPHTPTHTPGVVLQHPRPRPEHRGTSRGGSSNGAQQRGFLRPSVAVHVYPWAFMATTAALAMHVQVRHVQAMHVQVRHAHVCAICLCMCMCRSVAFVCRHGSCVCV